MITLNGGPLGGQEHDPDLWEGEDHVSIGGFFYRNDGTFLGESVDTAPTVRHITTLAFRNRFTLGEKVALEIASMDDPSAQMTQRQQAAMVRVYLSDVNNAKYIDLDRPDTRAGVQALEAAGLLAAGRSSEILDAPIEAIEMPTVGYR